MHCTLSVWFSCNLFNFVYLVMETFWFIKKPPLARANVALMTWWTFFLALWSVVPVSEWTQFIVLYGTKIINVQSNQIFWSVYVYTPILLATISRNRTHHTTHQQPSSRWILGLSVWVIYLLPIFPTFLCIYTTYDISYCWVLYICNLMHLSCKR